MQSIRLADLEKAPNGMALTKSALIALQKAVATGQMDLSELRTEVWQEIYTMSISPDLKPRTRLRAAALIAARTDPVNKPVASEQITEVKINILASPPMPDLSHGQARTLTDGNGLRLRLCGD